MRPTAILPLALGLLPVRPVRAQLQSGQAIEAARAQIDALRPDSAAFLVRAALAPGAGAGVADRLRGYVLLGVAELMNQRRQEARVAFQSALELDPELRVDTLADLTSDLVSTFNAERASLQRARSLTLVLEVPSDTAVPSQGGGFRVVVVPTRRAHLELTISGGAGETPFYREAQDTVGLTTFEWSLRQGDGGPIEPGRYLLRVAARDSVGETAMVDRAVTITREVVDTQALPEALGAGALESESLKVTQRSRVSVIRGLVYGAAAGALAFAGPAPSGVQDNRAIVVGGAVAVGGLFGYLKGSTVMVPDTAAMERNRAQIAKRDADRARVGQENAAARERARIRIETRSIAP